MAKNAGAPSKVVKNAAPPNAGKGRVKGVPNKRTKALKDAIMNAFAKVDGENYLVKVAKSDPRTFCALLGRVLPLQVRGDDDNPIKHEHEVIITGVRRAGD